jgi:2-octaprenyl-6-methoxyphenol hydroxylase
MSLRDIAALLDLALGARATGGDIGTPELLGRYHRARHADILARVTGVNVLNRAAMADFQALRNLRHAGLRALHGVAPLRRQAMALGLGR